MCIFSIIMYTNSLLVASGALFAAAAAVPMVEPHGHHHRHARDIVWVPHTEVVLETVAVTMTVWVDPEETAPTTTTTATPTSYPPQYAAPAPEPEPAETTPAAYSPPAPPAYTPQTSSSSSSTSVYVAPVPTTTSTPVAPTPYVAPTTTTPAPYVAPTTTTPVPVYVAPTPSPPAPAPAAPSESTQSSSGGLGGMASVGMTHTGDLTWYEVGLGACGKTNVASDSVVAVAESLFDTFSTGNPNTNPLCGKTITITGKDGSKYPATVVDRCTGCKVSDLDLSQDFFNKVTDHGDGRVGGMSWCFDD